MREKIVLNNEFFFNEVYKKDFELFGYEMIDTDFMMLKITQ